MAFGFDRPARCGGTGLEKKAIEIFRQVQPAVFRLAKLLFAQTAGKPALHLQIAGQTTLVDAIGDAQSRRLAGAIAGLSALVARSMSALRCLGPFR
jgi:hypothetical protein